MNVVRRFACLVLLLFSCGCSAIKADTRKDSVSNNIGTATMTEDGTIRLELMAESEDGTIGDAVFVYKPGDRMYDEVMKHLGGLKPGEAKPVPPWPARK